MHLSLSLLWSKRQIWPTVYFIFVQHGQYHSYSLFNSFLKWFNVVIHYIIMVLVRRVLYITMLVHQGGIHDTYMFSRTSSGHWCLHPRSALSLGSLFCRTQPFALNDGVCVSLHRDLDPQLKAALKEYLVARGVDSKLASSILLHLYQKEQAQYLKWLKTMEETFTKDHWSNHPSTTIILLSLS